MFTSENERCSSGQHNPHSKTHTRDRCWSLFPKKRAAFLKKKEESQVSNFSTFSSIPPFAFILDSGSSSHMVSDRELFFTLDEAEGGLINTSCGMNSLEIKGKGSIRVKYKDKVISFHNVLYVPQITVNVLSLRHLLLDSCNVNFYVNHFAVRKNEEPLLEGHYINNLPILEFQRVILQSHLSSAELLHKSLGHITKATFKHRTSSASKPLEELHLDLIGPVTPQSYQHHKYILTIILR
ncbi:hypothetical protein VP01_2131g1 [Puccinia sorghi]|uniref:Retrovirus-related Pol polyprotein from transposon TNT 1-94-like beta-barrel domain-containing protein n=1 Tax=Puccinia sorghi TaxID=27349 RepID=A0A0L6VBP3_9BASI|nr:hypothetical protein VP01_2131g1 [Puccinia sorghi]